MRFLFFFSPSFFSFYILYVVIKEDPWQRRSSFCTVRLGNIQVLGEEIRALRSSQVRAKIWGGRERGDDRTTTSGWERSDNGNNDDATFSVSVEDEVHRGRRYIVTPRTSRDAAIKKNRRSLPRPASAFERTIASNGQPFFFLFFFLLLELMIFPAC